MKYFDSNIEITHKIEFRQSFIDHYIKLLIDKVGIEFHKLLAARSIWVYFQKLNLEVSHLNNIGKDSARRYAIRNRIHKSVHLYIKKSAEIILITNRTLEKESIKPFCDLRKIDYKKF